jgi:hypothetical protein
LFAAGDTETFSEPWDFSAPIENLAMRREIGIGLQYAKERIG